MNPDVDARTHAKITTGRSENKFGVPIADAPALYARMAALPGIEPVGVAVHIGSQITGGVSAFRAAYARLGELVRELRAAGLPVQRVDCGGGLGIPYRDEPAPLPEALAGAIRHGLGALDLPVMLEPGRWIAGPAGVLLASVVVQKQGAARRFVVLDAAMNDLLRPAMYEAWHGILPVSPRALVAPCSPAEVVGPVCETGDTFARDRALPALDPGELVAILDAGAYGAAMSSTYNMRPLAAEVLVDGARFAVVRDRQDHAALLAGVRVPPWLENTCMRSRGGAPERSLAGASPPAGARGAALGGGMAAALAGARAARGLPRPGAARPAAPAARGVAPAAAGRRRRRARLPALARLPGFPRARATRRPSGGWNANPASATGRWRRWPTGPRRPETIRRRWPSGGRTRRAPRRSSRGCGSARRGRACRRATRWRCAPRWAWRWSPPSRWPAARRRNGCAAPSCPSSNARPRRPPSAWRPG